MLEHLVALHLERGRHLSRFHGELALQDAVGWPARGMTTIALAHITFSTAYVAVVIQSRMTQLDPSLRVVVAEEVFEADIPVPNVAHMQTRPARADRDAVDLRRLVAGFLRMAPDVAVVGEVRDRVRRGAVAGRGACLCRGRDDRGGREAEAGDGEK